jgi:hypothetical protein
MISHPTSPIPTPGDKRRTRVTHFRQRDAASGGYLLLQRVDWLDVERATCGLDAGKQADREHDGRGDQQRSGDGGDAHFIGECDKRQEHGVAGRNAAAQGRVSLWLSVGCASDDKPARDGGIGLPFRKYHSAAWRRGNRQRATGVRALSVNVLGAITHTS